MAQDDREAVQRLLESRGAQTVGSIDEIADLRPA
jgi:hypothetical protein